VAQVDLELAAPVLVRGGNRFEPERNGAPLLADLPGWTLTPDEYQTAQQAKNDAYTNHMRSQRLRNLRVAERRVG